MRASLTTTTILRSQVIAMLRPATGGSSASADRIFYFFVDESFGLTKDTILHLPYVCFA